MNLGICGKNALVTGASGGLGLATAVSLYQNGARVAIASRNQEKLEIAKRSIEESSSENNSHVLVYPADLSERLAALSLIQRVKAEVGPIAILIANSGGPKTGGFFDVDGGDLEKALYSNFLAMAELVQNCVGDMVLGQWGRIVAITSLWVRQPSPNLILSNSARSALTAYLKTASQSVADKGVTINTLQPGLHLTDRLKSIYGDNIEDASNSLPSKSLGDASDFGEIAAFLCSEQAKYINGASIPVDGGLYGGLI